MPTGIEHGTVTVVAGGKPYEVTTLRADVETDGRRAKVAFGRDWQARRRAARLHHQRALCRRRTATVVDLVGGLADIEKRTSRFIGDADDAHPRRIICASCASSASLPGTAPAGPMPRG